MPKSVEPINIQTVVRWSLLAGLLTATASCGGLPKSEAQTGQKQAEKGSASVDVAIARTMPLQQTVEYTGTTQPYRQVSLRSQAEGTVLDLTVDVGDRVTQGQTVGQLNDAVLTAAVVEAQAEVAARQAEVAEANAEVSTAQTLVEEQRLRLQQTRSDLARLSKRCDRPKLRYELANKQSPQSSGVSLPSRRSSLKRKSGSRRPS